MHFALKKPFFNRNSNKKKAKIPKISEILLNYFLAKIRKTTYNIFFPSAPAAGGLVKVIKLKKENVSAKKNKQARVPRGDQTC